MSADPPPEVIAFHEAGHVIAAWKSRVRVDRATIRRKGDRIGAVHYANDLELVDPADHIVILMAGAFSQRRLGRYARAWADSCFDDEERIKDNLAELASAEVDIELSNRLEECKKREARYCWRFQRRTLKLLRRHEAQVTAIAQALLEHTMLSENEILHILSSSR